MALPSTIYRAVLRLSDIDRGHYADLQATVARHPSETAERLVARLLAFALCHEDDLLFTRGIGAGDEPDLWVKGPDGRVRLWVEVGLPEAERLLKASRHAEHVTAFTFGSARRHWEAAHLPQLARAANLTVIALPQSLLDDLSAGLQRTIDWSLTISGGTLYITACEKTLEGSLAILKGEERA